MITPLTLPDDALLSECLDAAHRYGMHLITDGRRVLVSPIVPAGFTQLKITAKVRKASMAHLEDYACAA